MPKQQLEVHEHHYVSGRLKNGCYNKNGQWRSAKFSHSHEGGNVRHQHVDTGPAAYTIDKDDWYRTTGLRGGGRKKFTVKPTGEQLPLRELDDWQKSFMVVIGKPSPAQRGEGPGIALPARMVLTFGMAFDVEIQ